MPKLVLEDMIVYYAKVFDQEGKYGDIDRGDKTSDKKWLRDLAKQPVSVVDCYFPNDKVMRKLMDHPNFDNEVTNPQTGAVSTRIKDGKEDVGNGKFIKLKRKTGEVIEFFDKKKGEEVTIELDDFVRVALITKGEDGKVVEKQEYNYDELGSIGNDTVADVLFDIYGKGATRLEALGITKLVKYEPAEGGNSGAGF